VKTKKKSKNKGLPYIKRTRDKAGVVRCYFNKAGHPKLVLLGKEGSPEFMAIYNTAMAQKEKRQKVVEQAAEGRGGRGGTLDDLLTKFYKSAYWLHQLKESSRTPYRFIYERVRREYGHKLVRHLTKQDVMNMLDARAETPAAQETFHKRMRVLFDYAIEREFCDRNWFREVKVTELPTTGFTPWTDLDIQRFKNKYPSGTKQRLALVLLLHTTQRRSDAHRMGEHNIQEVALGWGQLPTRCLVYVQIKGRNGVEQTEQFVPLHPELEAELAHVQRGQPAFIVTQHGQPYSAAGFTNWFVEQAKRAGLVDRTPHGLRKAGSRHLAEAGASTHQIGAITGHKSLSEIELYTRSAAQKVLAQGAMQAVTRIQGGTPAQTKPRT
jgi:site-specific recombinase XerD